jgi:c-di-GMP-related signal transduction protein
VEFHDDFRRTLHWGYELFGGYFFSQPQILACQDIPAYTLNSLSVPKAVNPSQMNIHDGSEQVKEETPLCYRLLHTFNSSAFFLLAEMQSISYASSLWEEPDALKWASLAAGPCGGMKSPRNLLCSR